MKHRSYEQREPLTPWIVVKRRFFDGRAPNILAFSERHDLDVIEVMKLFSGDIISFSPKMCDALHNETKRMDREMSKDFFHNLSNRWPPHPPPAVSAALSQEGRSFL